PSGALSRPPARLSPHPALRLSRPSHRPATGVLTPSRGPFWPHPCSPRTPILPGPPSQTRPGAASQPPPRTATRTPPRTATRTPPRTATRTPPRTPPEAPPRSRAPPLLLLAAPPPTQFPQGSSTSCATGCSRPSERLL